MITAGTWRRKPVLIYSIAKFMKTTMMATKKTENTQGARRGKRMCFTEVHLQKYPVHYCIEISHIVQK